jgi:methylmalonyl-CoA/ethylmalonyl-CoA epimerase
VRFDRVDHTAVVVRDLGEALRRYAEMFELDAKGPFTIVDQRVEVAFLTMGDTDLELISPTDDTTGVARFLAKNGESLHHIGVQVGDIDTALGQLKARGYALIDEEARVGPHGRVAFLHPRSTGGVLYELVQRERESAS